VADGRGRKCAEVGGGWDGEEMMMGEREREREKAVVLQVDCAV
jgi:hypothetical protein